MQTVNTFDELRQALRGHSSCVSIGVFDGVHLGHQALINKTVETAKTQNHISAAITFRNHPLTVLAPPYTPRRLITPERKASLLHDLGVEIVLMLEFNSAFASMPPEQFVSQCLVKQAKAAAIICGYDFTFGAKGSGNTKLLEKMGNAGGFNVQTVDAIIFDNHAVKSTHVRDLLFAGHVSRAAALLTRPHELPGVIVSGFQRGRTIGFPTANLKVAENYQVPARGVYLCAARIGLDTEIFPAMVNIGTSPTFGENDTSVEAHILGFDGEIHGSALSLYFIERLRDERKFPGITALIEQLNKDRDQTSTLWASEVVQQIVKEIPAPVAHQL